MNSMSRSAAPARHAMATEVRVDLKCTDQKLVISGVDDGTGFDVTAVSDPHAVGLVGLQERAWIVGGTLEVRSALGMGTTVMLEVPLTSVAVSCEHMASSNGQLDGSTGESPSPPGQSKWLLE